MLTCPFINAECLTNTCQLWSSTNCAIQIIATNVATVMSTASTISTSTTNIDANATGILTTINTLASTASTISSTASTLSNNFSDVVGAPSDSAAIIPRHRGDSIANSKSNIVNLLKHEDAKHDNVILKNTPKTAKSNTLMMEYMGSEDLDDNGKVFGVDFAMKNDDSKPNALKSFDSAINKLGLPEISYTDYRDWAESDDPTVIDPLA